MKYFLLAIFIPYYLGPAFLLCMGVLLRSRLLDKIPIDPQEPYLPWTCHPMRIFYPLLNIWDALQAWKLLIKNLGQLIALWWKRRSLYRKVHAPFSTRQLRGLELYQRLGVPHPYTCGSPEGCKNTGLEGDRALIPCRTGMLCPCAQYSQRWVYRFSTQYEQLQKMKAQMEARGFKFDSDGEKSE